MWAKIFLYIFSLLWILKAILMIFTPATRKKICQAFLKGQIWLQGIVLVGLAFLLWYSTPASLSPCLVKAIALLVLGKGLFLLLIPKNDLQKTIDWLLGLSNQTYRIWGILLLVMAVYFFIRIV